MDLLLHGMGSGTGSEVAFGTAFEVGVRSHLAFGLLALLACWLQAATLKGGRWHRRIGRVYFLAVLAVVATAVALMVPLARGGHWELAGGLGWLAWITASAGSCAWLAVRWRQAHGRAQYRVQRVGAWGLLVLSTLLLGHFHVGGGLFLGLGVSGLGLAWMELDRSLQHLQWRSWKARHVRAVMVAGAAVHLVVLAVALTLGWSPVLDAGGDSSPLLPVVVGVR